MGGWSAAAVATFESHDVALHADSRQWKTRKPACEPARQQQLDALVRARFARVPSVAPLSHLLLEHAHDVRASFLRHELVESDVELVDGQDGGQTKFDGAQQLLRLAVKENGLAATLQTKVLRLKQGTNKREGATEAVSDGPAALRRSHTERAELIESQSHCLLD